MASEWLQGERNTSPLCSSIFFTHKIRNYWPIFSPFYQWRVETILNEKLSDIANLDLQSLLARGAMNTSSTCRLKSLPSMHIWWKRRKIPRLFWFWRSNWFHSLWSTMLRRMHATCCWNWSHWNCCPNSSTRIPISECACTLQGNRKGVYVFYPSSPTSPFYSCVSYAAPPDDIAILQTAHTIYRQQNQFSDSLRIAIRLRDMAMIKDDFESCTDP